MQNENSDGVLIRMMEGYGRWPLAQFGQAGPLASFGDIAAAVDHASDFVRNSDGRIVQHLD